MWPIKLTDKIYNVTLFIGFTSQLRGVYPKPSLYHKFGQNHLLTSPHYGKHKP